MIVDDNRAFRSLIRESLKTVRGPVMECDSGEEAIAMCEAFRPDWITMDLEMEGVDGLTAARIIRERLPDAAVLIVTQHDQPRLRRAAAEAGCAAFVAKENLSDLTAVIDSAARSQFKKRPLR